MNNSIANVDGKVYQKCNVIMLPTQKADYILGLDTEGSNTLSFIHDLISEKINP